MGLLTDTDLRAIVIDDKNNSDTTKLVISPFCEDCLTAVGYDLRVGENYVISKRARQEDLRPNEAFYLPPASTALIRTQEFVRMPFDRSLSGLIESKVSMVSQGLSHISTTVDPDWGGQLLIAVHNHSGEFVRLQHGETFCTMVFLRNESASTKRTARYDGRNDILVKHFLSATSRTKRRELVFRALPPAIVAAFALGGYFGFGNAAGFTAMTAAGAAIAQYVASLRNR